MDYPVAVARSLGRPKYSRLSVSVYNSERWKVPSIALGAVIRVAPRRRSGRRDGERTVDAGCTRNHASGKADCRQSVGAWSRRRLGFLKWPKRILLGPTIQGHKTRRAMMWLSHAQHGRTVPLDRSCSARRSHPSRRFPDSRPAAEQDRRRRRARRRAEPVSVVHLYE